VTTGFPPQDAKDFRVLLDWLDQLGLRQTCPEVFWLEIGIERGGIDLRKEWGDPEAMAIFSAVRTALVYIAENISALAFFEGAQERDLQCGIIFSPDEAYENAHFVARGMHVDVEHDELGRDVGYPGAPFQMHASPWALHRRPPLVGEHSKELLG
jgi:hypothetical protein